MNWYLVKIEREYLADGYHIIGIFETPEDAKESLERFLENEKEDWINDFVFIDKIELNKISYYDKEWLYRYSNETIFYAQIDLKGELIEKEFKTTLDTGCE